MPSLNPPNKALITGITGQDGAELLPKKGYEVHGIKRRASSFNTSRIDHLYQDPHVDDPRLVLHYEDLAESFQSKHISKKPCSRDTWNTSMSGTSELLIS